MIVQFLSFRWFRSKQGSAGVNQILAFQVHIPIHQKILLLRANIGNYPFDIGVAEQSQNTQSLPVQRLHAAEQRGFFIQGLAAIRAEGCRNAECFPFQKGITGGIPCGVPSGFKSCPKTSGREGRGVRFAFDQFFPGKFHNCPSVRGGINETVMLLSGDSGQRLEPVCEVRSAFLNSPGAHSRSNGVGKLRVKGGSVFYCLMKRLVDFFWQPCTHYLVIKNVTGKNIRYKVHGFILLFLTIKKRQRRKGIIAPFETPLSLNSMHHTLFVADCQRMISV